MRLHLFDQAGFDIFQILQGSFVELAVDVVFQIRPETPRSADILFLAIFLVLRVVALAEFDRAVENRNDFAHRDFFCGPRKQITALGSALGAYDSGTLELIEDLLQVGQGNVFQF